jgi:hypothetical protein
LPVGFATGGEYRDAGAETARNPATGKPYSSLGLTCAACHTGRMTYRGTEIFIDGGSALTNVVSFNEALVIALLYTDKLPFRYQRFATRVLGDGAGTQAKYALRTQFDAAMKQNLKVAKLELATANGSPTEGFGRLDAINRIGNRVFGVDMDRPDNYQPRPAPVHYPHVWTAPWFTWVQYNGSIMQPMVRNAGEALGVGAAVDLAGGGNNLFESSVHFEHLHQMERSLAGPAPVPKRKLEGLRSPAWPVELPAPDAVRARQGAGLYKELCQGCHLPPTDSAEFWAGPWWTRIGRKGDFYLDLHQIPVADIGTDPRQALGMATRTVTLPEHLNNLPEDMKFKSVMFGAALGQLVQNVTARYYGTRQPPLSSERRDFMNGGRPNDLQVKLEYKARPLNGIWAVPPYLHNGSVPSLYALLSPVAERPAIVHLGGREYDPVDVGYKNEAIAGGFALDTSIEGNRNTGHEFRDGPRGGGVIGRGLAPAERRALIEYLKTL